MFSLFITLGNISTQVHQRRAVGRIGIVSQDCRCAVDVGLHRASRHSQTARSLHHALQEVHRRVIVLALREYIDELQLLGGPALLQHLDKWQSDFSLAQVVVLGLARLCRAAVIQNVVLNLERHTYSLTEAAHLLHIVA